MFPPIKDGDKLYLVTRSDLSPGYQAVQSCHAMRQFIADFPEVDKEWFKKSNYLALLTVASEGELTELANKAAEKGFRCARFYEPDVNDALTAIALEPAARTLCKKLSLALE